jgi:exodeoxyribonuclease III
MIKIHSWNVNGLRAVIKKGFEEYLHKYSPDIVCLQEIKANEEQVVLDISNDGYEHLFWNSAEKKGYSGTAIFSKIKPINCSYGLGIDKHDHEGRVLTLFFKDFCIVNVYTPNSKRALERLSYRQKEWDVDFLAYINNLSSNSPVIVCGDFNVAPEDIDLTNPSSNRKNAGFTDEEREGFRNYLKNGFIDTFRELYPSKIKYTWWSNFANARERNIGWRIDHFLVTNNLISKIQDTKIYDNIKGSDHCPIELVLS